MKPGTKALDKIFTTTTRSLLRVILGSKGTKKGKESPQHTHTCLNLLFIFCLSFYSIHEEIFQHICIQTAAAAALQGVLKFSLHAHNVTVSFTSEFFIILYMIFRKKSSFFF